jgi:RND superfamily putative drug exporter
VVPGWLVFTAVLLFVGITFAAPFDNDFSGGHSDSQQAVSISKAHFPRQGDSIVLAVRADQGVSDPAVKPRVESLLNTVSQTPHVKSVASPYTTPHEVSADGKSAFALVSYDVTEAHVPVAQTKHLISQVKAARGGGVDFGVSGQIVLDAETTYGGSSDAFGVGSAMIVLLIAFGSLLAMGLPIITALIGIGTGFALIDLVGHAVPQPSFGPIVAGLIGLGVGIDYALFIVVRYREGLEEGRDPEDATVLAIATSGRSVLFAGSTVVIAMLGLLVMQQRLLSDVAVAASMTVLMTMITAVTLLPALLGFTGRNIDRLKLPVLGRTRTSSPVAERWAAIVQRRPLVALVTALVVLLVLAVPALSMRLSFEDSTTLPHSSSGYAAHKILSEGFGPGYDAPLFAVAELPPGGADMRRAVDAVRATPGVSSVTPPVTSPDGKAVQFVIYPKTAQLDQATTALVHTLRHDVLPKASPVPVHLGGSNSAAVDFADAVGARLPYLVAVVIALSLLVLLVLVRSVVIAVKAALMTLVSVGVAYGVLTAIVQFGWGGSLLGFSEKMPLTTWVPLFMFPILFGLSTDYEVFLISRIREEYDRGAPTNLAVASGLARTARVITAAAVIMVLVFLGVFLATDAAVKQLGLGLAIAVLVDATVVRMVLVPALMELLGDWNWWIPRRLARILPADPERATASIS